MTNKEIGMRIKEVRKEKDLTLEDIAATIGVARSTIQRYETGKIEKIKLPVITAIADALGVNDAWLVGKSEKKTISDADRFIKYAHAYNATHFPDTIDPVSTTTYPLLGEVACGQPIVANEAHEVYTSSTRVKADAVVKARGDSMTGARIFDGDVVFIRFQEEVENGQIAAVILESLVSDEDEIVLKRFYRYSNGLIVLRSENSAYKDIEIMPEDHRRVRILGKAVAFQSDIR